MKAESNLGGLLGKANRLLSNQFNQALTNHGITIEQWTLLAVLWGDDGVSQKTLQDALLKDKATINSLVGYLLKNGFITKERDINDKRSFIISLSEKGSAMRFSTGPLAMKSIESATKDIDADELAITTKVLTQIINNLTKGKENGK